MTRLSPLAIMEVQFGRKSTLQIILDHAAFDE
jgi:hypothetical protein